MADYNDFERRINRLEKGREECRKDCLAKHKEIQDSLANGRSVFTEHAIKISHLENWKIAQLDTIDDMRKDFQEFAREMRTEQQKAKNLMIGILSSLVVSALLLVFNVVINKGL